MWVAWTRHQRAPTSCVSNSRSTGRLPDQATQSSTSLVCSAMWMWIGASRSIVSSPATASARLSGPTRAQAVRGKADAEAGVRAVPLPHRLDDPQQPVGFIGEAALGAAYGRCAEPARVVEHRKEGERDAGARGRSRHPLRHFGEVAVGAAVRRVVQVMELGNPGVASLQHLAIELGRDRLGVVGAEPVDEAVHHLPPGPETVFAGTGAFGEPGHRALEGVAVEVRHPGKRDSADTLSAIPRLDPGDPAVRADLDGPGGEPAVRGRYAVERVSRHWRARVQSTMAASISRSTGFTPSARSGR